MAFIRTVGGCVRLLSGRHGAVDREVQPAAPRLAPQTGLRWRCVVRQRSKVCGLRRYVQMNELDGLLQRRVFSAQGRLALP